MMEVEEHWHSKSSVEQPADETAAEKMHDSAQSGTASALGWHGDTESQGLLVIGPVDSDDVVVGGAEVVAALVVVVTPGDVVAVATHEQTVPPAPMALLRSVASVQLARTQFRAMEEMALDDAGVHWPNKSVRDGTL